MRLEMIIMRHSETRISEDERVENLKQLPCSWQKQFSLEQTGHRTIKELISCNTPNQNMKKCEIVFGVLN